MITKIKINAIKNIQISDLCLQTYPCFHDVSFITNNNEKYIIHKLNAIEIMFYFLKIKQNIHKHFNYYVDKFISLINNKTIHNYVEHYDNIDNAIYCHKVYHESSN
jgi:hypothetical protein